MKRDPDEFGAADDMVDFLTGDPSVALRNVFDMLALSDKPALPVANHAAPLIAPEQTRGTIVAGPVATPFVRTTGERFSAFPTVGHQVAAIADDLRGGKRDPRLVAALGNSSVIGTDGGFLIWLEHAIDLIRGAFGESLLAPLTDRRRNGRGRAGLVLPGIDETSRADGSRWGGARAYWGSEGAQFLPSKPKYNQISLIPKKLFCFGYASDELLEDAIALNEHMKAVFKAEASFALDRAIMAGSGIGEPLGYLKSPSLITVAKEAGQPAGTILPDNIGAMWKRLPVASRRRAVWIVNEDVESSLTRGSGADDLGQVYQPAGTGGSTFPLLYGRPMIAMEQAPALGDVGDISVADLSQYLLLDLGLRSEMSIHVRFVEDEVAVRFIWRGDGAPGWKQPVLSANGSNTRSPFVTLEARV